MKSNKWNIDTLKEYIEEKFRMSEKATSTAYVSMEKRLDGMNELRSAMKDQASTFITRHEFDSMIESIKKLELFQAQTQGSSTQGSIGRTQNNWIVVLVLTIIMFVISISIQFIKH